MPAFSKSPQQLVERFETFTAGLDGVERRKMFGYPALFVGGNLATGLHEASWMVRLGPHEYAALMVLPGARPFEPMPGRPMKGYGVLPADVVGDDSALELWVTRALEFTRGLPPKR